MNIVKAYSKMMGEDCTSPIGWIFTICSALSIGGLAGFIFDDPGAFFTGTFIAMAILMLFAYLGKAK